MTETTTSINVRHYVWNGADHWSVRDIGSVIGLPGLYAYLHKRYDVESRKFDNGSPAGLNCIDEKNYWKLAEVIRHRNDGKFTRKMKELFPLLPRQSEEMRSEETVEDDAKLISYSSNPANDLLKSFISQEFGEVRILVEDDKVLFCGSDIAKALGYVKPNDAVSAHCRATVKRSSPISGKMQEINFIPEGDVYRLIVRSKLPSADRFEHWVFDDVLPSIRKHGMYAIDQLLDNPDLLIAAATQLKEEREKRKAAEMALEMQKQQNDSLKAINEVLKEENQKWDYPTMIRAMCEYHGGILNGRFQMAYGMFYKMLRNTLHINLHTRQGSVSKLRRIRASEWKSVMRVALPYFESKGVDVEWCINAVNTGRLRAMSEEEESTYA